MEDTYKNWKIKYDESVEVFVGSLKHGSNEHSIRHVSLKLLKNKIDKFTFKRIPVYYKAWGNIYEGEITSVSKGRCGSDYWISYINSDGDKVRNKCSYSCLYLKTEKNKKIFEQIEKLQDDINKLEKTKANLKDDLIHIKIND